MSTSESIEALRKQWGKKLFILGHYYQQDAVLQHADVTGDSLELARRAAAEMEAERIVFCGVHFMAESADILRGSHQTIYMPDIHAGCPMADMAPLREVLKVWQEIQTLATNWAPVVYVNSSAAVKAFLWRTWRQYLHVEQCGQGVSVGVRPRQEDSIHSR